MSFDNKKCCHEKPKLLGVWFKENIAFNVFLCEKCGSVYKEDVGNDEIIHLGSKGSISVTSEKDGIVIYRMNQMDNK